MKVTSRRLVYATTSHQKNPSAQCIFLRYFWGKESIMAFYCKNGGVVRFSRLVKRLNHLLN